MNNFVKTYFAKTYFANTLGQQIRRLKVAGSVVMLASSLICSTASQAALQFQVYNPGSQGIFPVTATLVTGPKSAMLVDAQFGVKDAAKLVEMIKQRGKQLSLVYISSGDPDFYFGLSAIRQAFPKVKIVASRSVVAHIEQTKAAKLAYWGPILAANAPTELVVPAVSDQQVFQLDGERIEVKNINSHQAYLWAPASKTVFGGVAVYAGTHVWTADTQSTAARASWLAALDQISALQPARVIPGHFHAAEPTGLAAVTFTKQYLQAFEAALASQQGSAAVIKALTQQYPTLAGEDSLAISAKVNTGEMKW